MGVTNSHRAITHQKPSGEDGQGFRDTLIWLTIKDYCKNCHEKQITFISNNDKDFGNADKTNLHESLDNECKELSIRINYCRNLESLLKSIPSKSQCLHLNG